MDASYFDRVASGAPPELPKYDGVPLSVFPPLRKDAKLRMKEIENFETRDDDILLSGFPKSGSHWMFEVISMLVSGRTELLEDTKEDLTIEMIPDVQTLHTLPSPRVLTTHLQYRFLPRRHRENNGKTICIIRNPKDCAVSCYHHFSRSKMSNFLAPDWDTLLHNFLSEEFMFGGWFKFCKEWWDDASANDSILILTYESCKKDLESNIKRIATFLNLNASEALIQIIAKKCDIGYMKQHKNDTSAMYSTDGTPLLFRKGQIGDWKTIFTEEQNRTFDVVYEEQMKGSELKGIIEFE